ncbi:MAG TPA: SIR2 family protein [Thermoanaerobaculia bacterium]|jgi:hypothetical protein
MEQNLRRRLANQFASGEAILFTGAGFSLGARAQGGARLPTVRQLREALWPLAFPNQPFDERSSLADIFDVATRQAGGRVSDLLRSLLTVTTTDLPESYRLWYSMPWARIYTLNVDNLDDVVQVAFTLPRALRTVSAITSGLPPSDGKLLSVHLNGRISEYPDITFSQRQYGERTARPDPWYQHLVTDLAGHPIVFVGTELDEPPLWQQMELRRARERRVRELRPGSYLVTPSLSLARRAMLEQFNIQLVEMTEEQFAVDVLDQMDEARQKGLATIALREERKPGRRLLTPVAELRSEQDDRTAEFLIGRQPTWADITTGRAVKREFEDDLRDRIRKSGARVVVVTGTAGAGKSTTLMRVALDVASEAQNVVWLDSDTDRHLYSIRTDVRDAKPDVLVIDDVDNFNANTATLLRQLITDNKELLVLATMRSTRFDRLDIEGKLGKDLLTYTVPHLGDSDITLLLDALTNAGRLGSLRGLSRRDQVKAFKDRSGRQLLVAMIEATSNERFEEKIDRECKELGNEVGVIYATVALATRLRTFVTKDEILLAINDSSNQGLNAIDGLITQRLLVVSNGNEIRLRHRVIAERATDYYRLNGQLAAAVEGLLWTMATKAHPELPKHSREHKLLRHLMNHESMIQTMTSIESARGAYELIDELQRDNYHYLLQRGSFEVEVGDLDLAKNYLDQARALAPTDYKVQTEWAYMSLKRASIHASTQWAPETAREALGELQDAITKRGKDDAYPYHVIGSQGLSWLRRAIIGPDERGREFAALLSIVREGANYHPRAADLRQLCSDLEREYLMIAVPQTSEATPKH